MHAAVYGWRVGRFMVSIVEKTHRTHSWLIQWTHNLIIAGKVGRRRRRGALPFKDAADGILATNRGEGKARATYWKALGEVGVSGW